MTKRNLEAETRRAAELRQNLLRRKQQQQGRVAVAEPESAVPDQAQNHSKGTSEAICALPPILLP